MSLNTQMTLLVIGILILTALAAWPDVECARGQLDYCPHMVIP